MVGKFLHFLFIANIHLIFAQKITIPGTRPTMDALFFLFSHNYSPLMYFFFSQYPVPNTNTAKTTTTAR